MSKRSDQCAQKFFRLLWPGAPGELRDLALGSRALQALPFVRAAFLVYEETHRDHGFDVRRWQLPFKEFETTGTVHGYMPWDLLLREAIRLIQEQRARNNQPTS